MTFHSTKATHTNEAHWANWYYLLIIDI